MWTSSDESVANVDENGLIKANKAGSTTITARIEKYPQFKAGVFCVGMGSKLFPKDKVAAEDWAYVTAKCEEALGYIAEARK